MHITQERRIEYIKTIIHGDHDMRQEQLVGVLKNLRWGQKYFFGPVDVFKQHNRDIYYVIGGPVDNRTGWTDPHLCDDERAKLQIVPITEVLDRIDTIPSWWNNN